MHTNGTVATLKHKVRKFYNASTGLLEIFTLGVQVNALSVLCLLNQQKFTPKNDDGPFEFLIEPLVCYFLGNDQKCSGKGTRSLFLAIYFG